MNRAHDSKIWKKHLFFLCTDLPIIKYNCLIDYRRSANDVVQNKYNNRCDGSIPIDKSYQMILRSHPVFQRARLGEGMLQFQGRFTLLHSTSPAGF